MGLYMRLCPSVGPWVGPSVRGSVRRSIRRSRVSQISRKSTLRDNKTSGNNEFKLIQYNSSKFKQIQENSFILTYIGRIFVRIELVSSQFVLFLYKIKSTVEPKPPLFSSYFSTINSLFSFV